MSAKTSKANLMVGRKAYRYLDNDNLEIIRITRVKNENCFICKKNLIERSTNFVNLQNSEERIILTKKQLDKYILLIPDALVIFTIIKVNDADDVAVNVIDYGKINGNSTLPYAICRQNVRDFFKSLIDIYSNDVGCSISQDSCPEGCDFKQMLAASSLIKKDIICTYLDDNLSDILSLLNHLSYNECLRSIYKLAAEHAKVFNYKMPDGYCKTIKELLISNNFIDDFDRCFNIKSFDKMKFIIKDNTLENNQLKEISEVLGFRPIGHFITPYNKTIDLSKISYNYLLIKDLNKLYLMIYGDKEKILPSFAQLHNDILSYYRNMNIKEIDNVLSLQKIS